jgi:hypothetical protein
MTLEQGCARRQPIGDEADKGSVGAGSGFKGSTARQFLKLLGKEPAQSWLRAIKPGGGGAAEHQGISTRADRAWINSKTADGFNLYAVIGTADKATGKGGGVRDSDVVSLPAVFVEWDDRPMEWQLQAWQTLNLLEPTVMVSTGGKSLHCYWVLQEPMEPSAWRVLQSRLIDYCKGDTQCKNPSRLMRLPGSIYFDKKTGEATGYCTIISTADARYTAAEIEACLPAPAPRKPAAAPLTRQWEPRGIDEINAAAEYIPRRVGGEGTYKDDWHALCGCSAALAEAGHPDPDGGALALLGHLWPSEAEARQALLSATTREAKSFWAIAGENGYQLKRSGTTTTQTPATTPNTTKAAKAPQKPVSRRKESKPRKLSHTKAMACFERCVKHQAKRERNSLRRRALLLAIAKALGLAACINRQEIAQRVLEAKEQQQGHSFKALTAADRLAMKQPVVRWLIADLVPAGDLTIIGGRPKVGKTRLAVAIAAAVLKGDPFCGFGCIKELKPVLLITDDQADGDTYQMLQHLKVWDHPLLTWSPHFRLNESDTDKMLATIKANPGALVVMDSLRSVSRSLPAGENDPEIGAYLYDLKAAVIDAGGTLLLIHHCNKAVDLVGVEALSGHNAIAGAANTVITLHHCPDANGRPDKSNPQRRLFSEGRSGAGCDLVIDRTYRQVATFDKWQQQLEEAKKQQKQSEGLTPTQQQLLELLEEEAGQAFTRRQLVEELGLGWGDGRGSDAVRVRDSLNRLAELKLITKERTGKEWTFAASHDAQNSISPSSPSSPSSDAKGFQGEIQGEEHLSFLSFQSQQGVSVIGADEEPPPPATKERKERFASPQTSPSDQLQQQQGEEGEEGEAHKHHARKKRTATIPGFVDPTPAPIGSGADVMDDGDDPAWPKRQEAA